ncbi:hypothetical protein CORC01_08204 [Colletotrichum orchidophilum]|uniref:Uncharacterized protein n=1 Tax=Colletotrichum orchidophilum TaxID=1209926 RepID=A0A1G4B4U8_9PEZI|nr:uncharacterized protein CORC01_08204 [Colletotrichum orchidophilum]OHE96441.1 hypothetical protein CORC01_08204 [Colletotrichum orchidophilum]
MFQPGFPDPPRWLIKSGVVGEVDVGGGDGGGGESLTSYCRRERCKSRFLQGNLFYVTMGTQDAVLSQVLLQQVDEGPSQR